MARTPAQQRNDYRQSRRYYVVKGAQQGAAQGALTGVIYTGMRHKNIATAAAAEGLHPKAMIAGTAVSNAAFFGGLGAAAGAAKGWNKAYRKNRAKTGITTYKRKLKSGKTITVKRRRRG